MPVPRTIPAPMAAGKPSKKPAQNMAPRIENRRVLHEYHVLDRLECGIVLRGSEVKSIRDGKVNLTEAYADLNPHTGELWLLNCEISPFAHAHQYGHLARTQRKLLAHRREIDKIAGGKAAKGRTLVPLAMYFVKGRVKVEIGLVEGKQAHDKREDSKAKDAKREMQRAMTRKRL